jgi:hypothetical protein
MVYERFAEFLKDYPRHSGLSDDDDEISLCKTSKKQKLRSGNIGK